MLGRTPARAARCTIASGRNSWTTRQGMSRIPDVVVLEAKPRALPGIDQIRFLDCAIVEPVEIVDSNDFLALDQEAVHKVRADETGAAGHDNFHLVIRP